MSDNKYSDSFSAEQLRRELERVKKRRFPFKKSKRDLDLKNAEIPRVTLSERGLLLKAEPSVENDKALSSLLKNSDNEKSEAKEAVIESHDDQEKHEEKAGTTAETEKTDAAVVKTDLAEETALKDEENGFEKADEALQTETAIKKNTAALTEDAVGDDKKDAADKLDVQELKNENVSKADRKPTSLELEKREREEKDKAFEILVGTSKKSKSAENVSADQIQEEIKRVRHKREYGRVLRETVIILLGVAAAAVLISMIFLPVLRVTGTSMEPTLYSDEIVVCSKYSDIEKGDIIAFYFNNKVLLKRVIGTPGDVITISESGRVIINGSELNEPYAKDLSLGDCDLEFPIQVPENRIFVMGDNRETSIDSRSSSIGYIADEYIIGKVIFRTWPIGRIGTF